MSSAGNPDRPVTQRWVWILLVILILALVCAFVFGTQTMVTLYSLLLPPPPPIPDGIELEHTQLGYGRDRWSYQLDLSLCETIDFYREMAGECKTVSLCQRPDDQVTIPLGRDAGRCVGSMSFTGFDLAWYARVDRQEQHTIVIVQRDIFWLDGAPSDLFAYFQASLD